MSTEELEQFENAVAVEEEPSPDLLIKHPLQNMWSLWFYKNDRTKSWEENLMEIITFDTVEDFWALYNHLEVVSKIPIGCDYALFKHGIKPMWEDSRNKQGGRWLLNVQKSQRNTDLNNYWLEILLCLIGEAFCEYSDDICGAVAQIRNKGDKLAVWTSNVKHQDAIMKIGQIMKDRLNLHPRNVIGYEAHTDTQVKTGSAAKCRYTL
ncbi:eukaryotic translation initiation factor 4E [Trichonephila inaurata madagascariensis]|uniref:eIF-4F 25 kDa subunit n=1 Tax=Trichonephila inaurata madagascariensis TaxID=2747483 RepID=A0A8X7CC09_9ARAC|nr:eukaryotic translation initiation factor 4E [Trichonephila inaurata madagascariensis]